MARNNILLVSHIPPPYVKKIFVEGSKPSMKLRKHGHNIFAHLLKKKIILWWSLWSPLFWKVSHFTDLSFYKPYAILIKNGNFMVTTFPVCILHGSLEVIKNPCTLGCSPRHIDSTFEPKVIIRKIIDHIANIHFKGKILCIL